MNMSVGVYCKWKLAILEKNEIFFVAGVDFFKSFYVRQIGAEIRVNRQPVDLMLHID